MAFIIDKQTLTDLKVFNKPQSDSIYGLYNHTHTLGGAKLLEEMFRYPLSSAQAINQRIAVFRLFRAQQLSFTLNTEWFDAIEHYLSNTDERTRLKAHGNNWQQKINRAIGADVAYTTTYKAVTSVAQLFRALEGYLPSLATKDTPHLLQDDIDLFERLRGHECFGWITPSLPKRLPYALIAKCDELLRFAHRDEVKQLLAIAYRLDLYCAVAHAAQIHNLCFPEIFDEQYESGDTLVLEGLRHPLLPHAVTNDITLTKGQQVIFLTGANMAGKSTFMKAFSSALYLAHIGMPVAATCMRCGVYYGMYTTINLPDNMHLGLSHFYAEVKRLRRVADQVHKSGRLIVIFDELFRGTNVKDAHEATVEVMKAFCDRPDSLFMISTHIVEAGEELAQVPAVADSIRFVYFPTLIDDQGKTRYTYAIADGITADRHGMMIVRNEKILEILTPRKS